MRRFPRTACLVLFLSWLGQSVSVQEVPLTPGKPLPVRILPNSTVVLVASAEEDTAFWVFESHTQARSLVMRHLNSPSSSSHGSHAGVVVHGGGGGGGGNSSSSNVSVELVNPHAFPTSALVLARPYQSGAPVPGACRPGGKENSTELNFRPGVLLFYDSSTVHC